MEKSKKKEALIGAGVVVVIVAIILFFNLRNKKADVAAIVVPPVENITIEPKSTLDTSGINVIPPVVMSYADALVKYADKRLQFDKDCQVSLPNNVVTYKDNTGIMIDNRSSQTRTIKIGTTFTIKPYSFKIVVLPDVYLKTNTLLVDCDNSKNVATILVQE
ncbi:MAG: hypothetical protein WCI93_03410 [bacterium]